MIAIHNIMRQEVCAMKREAEDEKTENTIQ